MNSLTNPVTSLKWGSIAFAVLWTGWMVWWSKDFAPVNVVILTICGAVAGYLWYRLMCWQFRRLGLAAPASSSDAAGK
jgi:UDP-N-acetylmuramyl pentapeptide phosphotransferase/UDP-N-acetylglucosamine-1-phosphate transferase